MSLSCHFLGLNENRAGTHSSEYFDFPAIAIVDLQHYHASDIPPNYSGSLGRRFNKPLAWFSFVPDPCDGGGTYHGDKFET